MQVRRLFRVWIVLHCTLLAGAQQPMTVQRMQEELALLKQQVQRLETALSALARQQEAPALAAAPAPAPAPVAAALRPPALNTPPALPPSGSSGYQKTPPRFDILLQSRADFFPNSLRHHTFHLRKAELGVKAGISPHVDFSFELDALRPNDPYRRTYLRLSHLGRLHVKLGLEKSAIGLEELSSTGEQPFVERSEVSARFAAAEEMGVHLDSRWDQWLLQFSVSNGARRLLRDDNQAKDVSARAVWGPLPWFSWGVAALRGATGADERNRDRYNTELKIGSNLTGVQTEFYRARDHRAWSSAFYVSAYRAFRADYAWLTHFQPVIRYEQIGRGDRDRDAELRLLTTGFSLLFDGHHSKLQVNYLKDLRTGTRKDEVRTMYQVEF